jgi:hypothetical protein
MARQSKAGRLKSKHIPIKTGNPSVDRLAIEVYKLINNLQNAVNRPSGFRALRPSEGGEGDLRLYEDAITATGGTQYYLQGKFPDGWASVNLTLNKADPEEVSLGNISEDIVGNEGAVIADINYTNLNINQSVGGGAAQVAPGQHVHDHATGILNVGTNTHDDIDTHLGDDTIHFVRGDTSTTMGTLTPAGFTGTGGAAGSASRADHTHTIGIDTQAPGAGSASLDTSATGTANAFSRSDHTHSISQSITPTWTGQHIFNGGATAAAIFGKDTVHTGALFSTALRFEAASVTDSIKFFDTSSNATATIGANDSGNLLLDPAAKVTIKDTKGAGSEAFVGGYFGAGWELNYDSGTSEYSMTVDNLTVRGTMSVYELLIQQIRATNGSIIVGSADRIDAVEVIEAGATGKFKLTVASDTEDEEGDTDSSTTFAHMADNDLILAQKWQGTSGEPPYTPILQIKAKVFDTNATDPYDESTNADGCKPHQFKIEAYSNGDLIADGLPLDFVRVGNTVDANRQGGVYLTADDDGAPFIDVFDGVNSWADWRDPTKTKARLGRLDNITNVDAGLSGGQTGLYGLYSKDVYLEGHIRAKTGFIGGSTGGWSINATGINATNNSAYIEIGTGGYGSTGGVYIGGTGGRLSLGNKLRWDGNDLTVSGTFTGGDGLPIGVAWRGPWRQDYYSTYGKLYQHNDGVSNIGSSWICKASHSSDGVGANGEPGVGASAGTYWDIVASVGDTGSTGSTGTDGVTGATGDTGASGATGAQGEGILWEYTKRQDACTDEGSFALQDGNGAFTGSYNTVGIDGFVRINKDDKNGVYHGQFLNALTIGDRFQLTNMTGGSSTVGDFGLFEVRAAVTFVSNEYYLIPVELISYQGTSGDAANDHNIAVNIGAQGATGATGDTGSTGTDGVTGSTGADGVTGQTGSTGTDGVTGQTGATGSSGATGEGGYTTLQYYDYDTSGDANGVGRFTLQDAYDADGDYDAGTSSGDDPSDASVLLINKTSFPSLIGDTSSNAEQVIDRSDFYDTVVVGDTFKLWLEEHRWYQYIITSKDSSPPSNRYHWGIGFLSEDIGAGESTFDTWGQTAAGDDDYQFRWNKAMPGATGATGSTGDTGSTGTDGVTGADGVTGLTGSTGSTGTDGVTGQTGSTGTDGVTGATGQTGSTGSAGVDPQWLLNDWTESFDHRTITGSGSAGWTGNAAWTTTTFSQGCNLQFMAGTTGNFMMGLSRPTEVHNPDGGSADSYQDIEFKIQCQTDGKYDVRSKWDTNAEITHLSNQSSYNLSSIFNITYDNDAIRYYLNSNLIHTYGSIGAGHTFTAYAVYAGATASIKNIQFTDAAAIGATGVTGQTGSTGTDGVTGATGTDGVTGATGTDGVTGATGTDGVTGLTGATGTDGVTGLTGSTGATGGTGPPGSLFYWTGSIPIPTNVTDINGATEDFVFSSAVSGDVVIKVTGTDFEGACHTGFNGVDLGTMTGADNATVTYTFASSSLIVGTNTVSIWSTTGDAGPILTVEVQKVAERGSLTFYHYTQGSAWADATANYVITQAGLTKVNYDTVVIINSAAEDGWTTQKWWDGDSWEIVDWMFDGDMVVHGTIGADQVDTTSVFATNITATGIITGAKIRTAASGERIYLNEAGGHNLRLYDAANNKTVEIDAQAATDGISGGSIPGLFLKGAADGAIHIDYGGSTYDWYSGQQAGMHFIDVNSSGNALQFPSKGLGFGADIEINSSTYQNGTAGNGGHPRGFYADVHNSYDGKCGFSFWGERGVFVNVEQPKMVVYLDADWAPTDDTDTYMPMEGLGYFSGPTSSGGYGDVFYHSSNDVCTFNYGGARNGTFLFLFHGTINSSSDNSGQTYVECFLRFRMGASGSAFVDYNVGGNEADGHGGERNTFSGHFIIDNVTPGSWCRPFVRVANSAVSFDSGLAITRMTVVQLN